MTREEALRLIGCKSGDDPATIKAYYHARWDEAGKAERLDLAQARKVLIPDEPSREEPIREAVPQEIPQKLQTDTQKPAKRQRLNPKKLKSPNNKLIFRLGATTIGIAALLLLLLEFCHTREATLDNHIQTTMPVSPCITAWGGQKKAQKEALNIIDELSKDLLIFIGSKTSTSVSSRIKRYFINPSVIVLNTTNSSSFTLDDYLSKGGLGREVQVHLDTTTAPDSFKLVNGIWSIEIPCHIQILDSHGSSRIHKRFRVVIDPKSRTAKSTSGLTLTCGLKIENIL